MPELSIVIPCKNEEKSIKNTIFGIKDCLVHANINFEIIIVNDGSSDSTENIVEKLVEEDKRIRMVVNHPPNGIGYAIRKGLKSFRGAYVIIAMADASDDPKDMVLYYEKMLKGFDCCFGQRWRKESIVKNYPMHKLVLNRIINWLIRFLFGIKYTDITNAFKCYSRETIEGIKPFLSRHFNITVELPLKAIVRGYKYTVISTHWYNRKEGISRLKIQEMGSHYFFIIIYVLLEKFLCGDDYKRKKT